MSSNKIIYPDPGGFSRHLLSGNGTQHKPLSGFIVPLIFPAHYLHLLVTVGTSMKCGKYSGEEGGGFRHPTNLHLEIDIQ